MSYHEPAPRRSGSASTGVSSLDALLADALATGSTGSTSRTAIPGYEPSAGLETPFNRQPVGDPNTFANHGAFGAYYTQSDIFLPMSLGADGIFALQQALNRSGWLTGDIDHPGQWDRGSQDAFADLLEYANQQGIDWRDALGQSLDAQGAGAQGDRSQLPPLTIQLPNEADVRKGVEDVARATSDVNLGDEFYRHIADQYMDALRTAQLRDAEAQANATRTIRSNASATEAFGRQETVEQSDPQSLESFTEDAIERERPREFRNARVGDAEESFMEIMTRSYG